MDWFKVKGNYPDDKAIQQVGERGEILFFRGLAYCASADSDGFIPETQLPRFGLRQITIRVAALLTAGLWDVGEHEGIKGYWVRNWLVIQSEAYAAQRKKIKDRNRAAAHRAQQASSEGSQSYDCRATRRTTIAPLEEEEEITPNPATRGASCDKEDPVHPNCRGCGTNRRAAEKAARTWKPPWCGNCDERTRLIGYDGPTPVRCDVCHPLVPGQREPLAADTESA